MQVVPVMEDQANRVYVPVYTVWRIEEKVEDLMQYPSAWFHLDSGNLFDLFLE